MLQHISICRGLLVRGCCWLFSAFAFYALSWIWRISQVLVLWPCLSLIKDLLQSANLIPSIAVLCSALNSSRNFTAHVPLTGGFIHLYTLRQIIFNTGVWISSPYQVNNHHIFWIYNVEFFVLCPKCWWMYEITFHRFAALNVPQRSSLTRGQTSLLQRDSLYAHLEVFFKL